MNEDQLEELLYQALETEKGGVEVYRKALECAVNEGLKEEWTKYLEQTQNHLRMVEDVLDQLGLELSRETPGRQVVRHIGQSLVRAMELAQAAGEPDAAQLVAAECVVLAETKDHLNWELIGEAAQKASGKAAKALRAAYGEVSTGWTRELWIGSLGMPAVLPPPEEEKHIKTAIGAARAKNERAEML